MDYPTQPAFVVQAQGWDEHLLQHTVMKFIHAHEQLFDAQKYDECGPFYGPVFTYVKSNGQKLTGEQGVVALHGDYTVFAGRFHEPANVVVSETEDGYRLFGYARIFVNLPVVTGNNGSSSQAGDGSDRKCRDLQGRRWDCEAQGAFIFDFLRDPAGPLGFRYKFFQILADPTPILSVAMERDAAARADAAAPAV
ncbi:hypothetical protein B0T22DRAFT_484273 [Podospora appendiculata]|uniref:SnoaL-like domain-containing protein n=1 Tax=Podospora appendiculata TaxID=314037 RepID=A0AAE0X0Z6_9PEZI|nr:hypothetical protein B0T22DRAFT_484273 [Podospora appendiculata]